eukprot:5266267-Amphidinium_carterae.1
MWALTVRLNPEPPTRSNTDCVTIWFGVSTALSLLKDRMCSAGCVQCERQQTDPPLQASGIPKTAHTLLERKTLPHLCIAYAAQDSKLAQLQSAA